MSKAKPDDVGHPGGAPADAAGQTADGLRKALKLKQGAAKSATLVRKWGGDHQTKVTPK